ncbi:biotin/lipoate A/B protein ligase family protein [Anabaena cylindrica UHCC 0172]|uniref:lipoate--protein ligase family protein n=1 Tax=Anabaena cylindrica TaxID=1165 RepID=UPI002B1F683C|nr:biotin/lipoate A/B protein ligase family protein [Anabaena cylindrica]MEA5550014.1 biotin/lipoate A/B protein ligase family protein [Anabaena cylindrica UHCC 0172]
MQNKQAWRLIPLIATTGNLQMAIDHWLLEQHESGNNPSTLRFYTWSPAAISLGYHQKQYPEYWQNLNWQGEKLDLVRRPSGGRAVLHQGDLTYAVVTSGMMGNRLQVYGKICEFLIAGWRSLGVDLNYGQAGRGYIHNPNCFGTATGADLILADGSKLIGSAQLRRGEAILQHGSIQLNPDADLFKQVFGKDAFTPVQLPQNLNQETLIEALIIAACDCFNMQIEVKPLSETEWEAILTQPSLKRV